MDKYHWKERFKISKIAKFESDLLKTNEDIASQSREILQTFVRWGSQTCPLPYKHLYNFDVKYIWNNSFLNCGCRWKWRMIIAVNFPI